MGFGNSGNYNGGYNNGGGYNGGNGYNNGYGGGRGSGGGLVCPQCGGTSCHAQIRNAGEKLYMFDFNKGNRSGLFGMLFSGLHTRSRRYASYATCNSCGYSWQVGKSKRSSTFMDYIFRIIIDFLLAGVGYIYCLLLKGGDPFHAVLFGIIGIVVNIDLITGFITNRILDFFG